MFITMDYKFFFQKPLTFISKGDIIALALLEINKQQHASVAQLDRAYGYGP